MTALDGGPTGTLVADPVATYDLQNQTTVELAAVDLLDKLYDPTLEVIADRWEPPPDCRYHGWRLWAKHIFDRTVAAIGLTATAPLFGIVALIIKVSSRGPVIFVQERVGRFGEPFKMMKFRTMVPDAEEWLRQDPSLMRQFVENDFKLPDDSDPRVTRFGSFLRRSSLDELPQLVNIVRGQMSLVGPRPVEREQLASYGPWVDAYLSVYPGLTGIWQVGGHTDVRFPERAILDVHYLSEWSLRADLMLLARTVPVLIRSGESSGEAKQRSSRLRAWCSTCLGVTDRIDRARRLVRSGLDRSHKRGEPYPTEQEAAVA